jgi:hypothetical protein
MGNQKPYCRFEKAAAQEANLSDSVVHSFLAHVNRVSKQERKGISKSPKLSTKEKD